MLASALSIDIPEKLGFLALRRKTVGEIIAWGEANNVKIEIGPDADRNAICRWKVIYGGRDGAKSWSIGRALLGLGRAEPLRVLCARELMTSIDESVHQLLTDQIEKLGLEWFYKVDRRLITAANGTLFSYVGLRHNVLKVKSFEGYDVAWVEEAKDVLKSSWLTLENTIRKPFSELWVSFNPELATDPTFEKLIRTPPPDAVICKMSWRDNPWASDALRVGREQLKLKDPDEYEVVWEGHCRTALEGAIYEKELRTARSDGRITRVPYDRSKPVQTAWDLGRSDMTAIWFFQRVGFEWRILDYYQDTGFDLSHYLLELQSRGYVYSMHWLPHDAESNVLGAKKTIAQQARDVLGADKVRIVKRLTPANGINAARTVFPHCWFDAEKCDDGLQALAHYIYKVDPETKERSKEPLHNWASHGADAFRYYAVSIREGEDVKRPAEPVTPRVRDLAQRGTGWMRR